MTEHLVKIRMLVTGGPAEIGQVAAIDPRTAQRHVDSEQAEYTRPDKEDFVEAASFYGVGLVSNDAEIKKFAKEYDVHVSHQAHHEEKHEGDG